MCDSDCQLVNVVNMCAALQSWNLLNLPPICRFVQPQRKTIVSSLYIVGILQGCAGQPLFLRGGAGHPAPGCALFGAALAGANLLL